MRFFSARSLILSPSRKSIARRALPSRPALNSLSGSASFAPYMKVSFTFPLWALATAMMPSRDHTGLPIHFHLDDLLVGFEDGLADAGKSLAAPVGNSREQLVDTLRWSHCVLIVRLTSRRTRWPFHIQSPDSSMTGKNTNRVGGA